MKMFLNMRLAHKLLLMLVIVLAGFMMVGVSFYNAQKAEEVAALDALQASGFGELVDSIYIGVLNSRRYEKDFQIEKDMSYLEKYEQSMAEVIDTARSLRESMVTDEAIVLGQVISVLEAYRSDFYAAAESQVAVGLDDNSGLLGDMNASARELKKAVGKIGSARLDKSVLLIEKYADSYIESADPKYVELFEKEKDALLNTLKNAGISEQTQRQISEKLMQYHKVFMGLYGFIDEKNAAFAKVSETVAKLDPLIDTLVTVKRKRQADNWASINIVRAESRHQYVLMLVVTASVISLLILIYTRTYVNMINKIEKTVNSVAQGDYEARSGIVAKDEIGLLSQALDKLLDERVAHLMKVEEEKERLNESVIALLEAVSLLSQRDLTVKVPVTEDVTGPVADALNLLTAETARVLYRVTAISEYVSSSSEKVKGQSDDVIRKAQVEFVEVQKMIEELADAFDAMNKITRLAQSANEATDRAKKTTDNALHTVNETVHGIQSIREVIREAEKRIKRLGERSQEIGGTVDLISNIAERTHILALNASMHASSSGDGGRGFAVVADEVQRLAENAQDATGQISTLVKNIQLETADTVGTMNRLVNQVMEGTRLAEQAGVRMNETKRTTEELVAFIQQIATNAQNQIEVNKQLRKRTDQVLQSSRQTAEQLREQGTMTESLVKYARQLLMTVRVFKLPVMKKAA
ncbi:MAG TPA: methyl-accepting chemotaxis protein [Candidatus Tenderia sp.]|nr:methyl-accepting chemotaxis protein [Candidatus Tenderia sp.]